MHVQYLYKYAIKAVMFPTVNFARTHRIRHLSVILKEESTFHWDGFIHHPNSISASAPIPFPMGREYIWKSGGGKARSSRLADFSAILSVSNYILHTHTHTYICRHTWNGNLSWRSIDRIKVEFPYWKRKGAKNIALACIWIIRCCGMSSRQTMNYYWFILLDICMYVPGSTEILQNRTWLLLTP